LTIPKQNPASIPSIVPKDSTQIGAKETRTSNISLATVIAEMMERGFGPKGAKKLITNVRDPLGWASDTTNLTSDGYTILNETSFKQPIGKILTETAKTVNDEVGDGVKTTIILVGKLLDQAQRLIDEGLHPRTVIDGYQKACQKLDEITDSLSVHLKVFDDALLKNIALTAMRSKIPYNSLDHVANLVVKTVNRASEENGAGRKLDLANIKIEKQVNGLLSQSYFFDGWIVAYPTSRYGMIDRVENARIAFITRPVDAFSMGDYSAKGDFVKIEVTKKEHVNAFSEKEKSIALKMAQKIAASGANVVISNWNIDEAALEYFSSKGILAFKRLLMPDLSRIQKATGGLFVERLDDLTPESLGTSKLVYIEKMNDKEYAFFKGCQNPKAASIMLRSGSAFLVDEAERGVKDALSAIKETFKDPRVVFGGGAFEVEAASQLKTYAQEIGKRDQLAINAFAKALEELCVLLCRNAGTNPLDILPEIKTRHEQGEKWVGIDPYKRNIGNMKDLNVYEPVRVKLQAINAAFETVEMLLRIDYSITAKLSGEKKPHKEKTAEEIEKLEQDMIPKVLEQTSDKYVQPWEKGLQK
jgi:chaperonin GroEL (HSP60 family)